MLGITFWLLHCSSTRGSLPASSTDIYVMLFCLVILLFFSYFVWLYVCVKYFFLNTNIVIIIIININNNHNINHNKLVLNALHSQPINYFGITVKIVWLYIFCALFKNNNEQFLGFCLLQHLSVDMWVQHALLSPYAILPIYSQNPFIVKLLTAVLTQEPGKYSLSTSAHQWEPKGAIVTPEKNIPNLGHFSISCLANRI